LEEKNAKYENGEIPFAFFEDYINIKWKVACTPISYNILDEEAKLRALLKYAEVKERSALFDEVDTQLHFSRDPKIVSKLIIAHAQEVAQGMQLQRLSETVLGVLGKSIKN
jgi:hypothetical protein